MTERCRKKDFSEHRFNRCVCRDSAVVWGAKKPQSRDGRREVASCHSSVVYLPILRLKPDTDFWWRKMGELPESFRKPQVKVATIAIDYSISSRIRLPGFSEYW